MMAFIRAAGGTVVEVDTDGIFFLPPPAVTLEDEERAFVASLSDSLPDGITVAHAGRYRRMLSYKKKNYALLGYDERITLRGSSLVNRSMEGFGRTFVAQCVDHLLHENVAGMHEQFVSLRAAMLEHRLDVRDFARVETLRDSLDEYQAGVRAGTRNRSAAYEVALATRRRARPGTRVAYYITGTEAHARGFENAKSVEEWDPNFPDENTAYYLKRLEEYAEKFASFFEPQDFRAIFSADDLFPFDPRGITPITRTLREEAPDDRDDAPPDQFGIWLDV
jgi:DNA polymerase elongation subunit (family B)